MIDYFFSAIWSTLLGQLVSWSVVHQTILATAINTLHQQALAASTDLFTSLWLQAHDAMTSWPIHSLLCGVMMCVFFWERKSPRLQRIP